MPLLELSQADELLVPAQLLLPNPPQPNNLPTAMITGQLNMPKAQYLPHLSLASSIYFCLRWNAEDGSRLHRRV